MGCYCHPVPGYELPRDGGFVAMRVGVMDDLFSKFAISTLIRPFRQQG
jgi:hypothetical protein